VFSLNGCVLAGPSSLAGWLAVVVLQLRHAVLHRRIPDPNP
jgi:hypothetical protein